MPEARSAAVALAGAIVLGSLVGAAIPTRMKAPIGPDWRERYGISFDASAPSFYVEPAPQDLTPVSDPYFVDAYDARAVSVDPAPGYAEDSYRPFFPQEATFVDAAPAVNAAYEGLVDDDRQGQDGSALSGETSGMAPAVAVVSGAASLPGSTSRQGTERTAETATTRIDAAAAAAQQVVQAVNQAQGSPAIATAAH